MKTHSGKVFCGGFSLVAIAFLFYKSCAFAGENKTMSAENNNATAIVETVVSFMPDKWNKAPWTPIRMANQSEPFQFAQFDDGIGTDTNTFTHNDYSKECDNALLLYDTGLENAEVSVIFSMRKGSSAPSSPGIGISPLIENGVFKSGLAVFVARYGMVVWYEYTDETGNKVQYKHLAQLTRHSDPTLRHELRFRFNQKAGDLGISLDDSEPLVFRFVGKRLSNIPQPLNSQFALWGCHGASIFHEVKIIPGGALPFRGEPAQSSRGTENTQ